MPARRMMQTDEEAVKAKLVRMISSCTKVDEVVALAQAFAKIRAVELKQDEGLWGQELPGDGRNGAEVRS